MIDCKMIIEGKTGFKLTCLEQSKEFGERFRTDLKIELKIYGINYGNSTVEFQVNANIPFFFSTNQLNFHKIANVCRIEDSRHWCEIMKRIDNQLEFSDIIKNYYYKLTTVEANIHKSAFLLYNWMESSFVLKEKDDIERKIFDEFVINATNEIGNQNYLYFIPEKLNSEENQPLLNILTEKELLLKFSLKIADNLEYANFFLPLIKAIEGPNTFNTNEINELNAKRIYHSIKNSCSLKVRNHFKDLK